MTNRITVAVGVVALLIAAHAHIEVWRNPARPPPAAQREVARGEYLAKGIAGCPDCHTPYTRRMTSDGQIVAGGGLTFGPIVPLPVWADTAPKITGLEGWDREKAVQLLMKGLAPNGPPPRPPMPRYRMNRGDAEAVVAYLKSLKSAGKHRDATGLSRIVG